MSVYIFYNNLNHTNPVKSNPVYCLYNILEKIRRYLIIYDLTLQYFLLKSNPRIKYLSYHIFLIDALIYYYHINIANSVNEPN